MIARFDEKAEIIEHCQAAEDIFVLKVAAPAVSASARPGQFCMVEVKAVGSSDPLLRRPFSIHAREDGGRLSFLYRRVGRGTDLLSRMRPGEMLNVLGPLGRGFRVRPDITPILAGGGMGMAPLLFLAEYCAGSMDTFTILGGRTASELTGLESFRRTGTRVLVATEDGSLGTRGMVTDVLDGLLKTLSESAGQCEIHTCGPWPMMRAVYEMASQSGIPCWVSLESRMACGTGLCLGCAVYGTEKILHVCREGPVFHGDSIRWRDGQ